MLQLEKNIFEVRDIHIELTIEQNDKANAKVKTFVDRLSAKKQSHSYYENKRNTSAKKAAEDNFIGKKAEVFAWWYFVSQHGFPRIGMDFEIRNGSSKGWNIDLPFKKENEEIPNVHVKACQEWMVRYAGDFSWTFQFSNNDNVGGKDDIFNGPDNDLIAFLYLENSTSPSAIIKAILPWGEVKKHLKDPLKESLIGLKKCVYLKDLQEAVKQL